jgi:hypothetical protein
VLRAASLPVQQAPGRAALDAFDLQQAPPTFHHIHCTCCLLRHQATDLLLAASTALCRLRCLCPQHVLQEGVCVRVLTRRQPPVLCRPLWRRAGGNHHTASSSSRCSRCRGAKLAARTPAGGSGAEQGLAPNGSNCLCCSASPMLQLGSSKCCTSVVTSNS